MLAGLVVMATDRVLGDVLIKGGGVLAIAVWFWSQRHEVSVRRRRLHLLIVGVLALGWLSAVVTFAGDR